ncbi:MAG: FGGY-family carbohydrate kinase [Candidatus Humimicrobiaceae bacterium]
MSEKYLAGIDIGTTGAKVALFNLKGDMLSSGYREYSCAYPKPGWVEQDLKIMVKSALEASRECMEKTNIKNTEIATVSLSTQRSCTIFADKDGNEIMPMISWQDGRSSHEAEYIKNTVGADNYYKITGLPIGPTWVLTKILWLQKNEPEKWKKVSRVLQLQDYFLKKLGSNDFAVDIPDAAMFGLWETDKFRWSEDLLKHFNLTSSNFSSPVPSGTIIGKISKSVSELSGLAEGTPLCVGAGDQNSAVIGAGVINDGQMSVSIGTGGIAITFLDKPFRDPNKMNMITNHAINGKWQMEGLQNGAAGVFRWFRDEIAFYEKKEAEKENKNVYAILDSYIEKTPPGSKGLLLLPFFAGSAAPRWNSDARGTIIGLTFAHDKACLARCFIEGITLEMKDIISSIIKSGIKINSVKLIGGASKSHIWNKIQADMYKKDVSTLKISDAAILGAAIFAGVGIKAFSSIEEGVKNMINIDRTYTPGKNSKIYDKIYEIYCKAYEGLSKNEVFSMISDLQAEY